MTYIIVYTNIIEYEPDIVNNDIIDYKSDETKQTKFVATNEWQKIKDGQKVPSGLHYRMNLETGLKEAKILEGNIEPGMAYN